MPKRLPLRLALEPLVDSACELRVASSVDLHTILPGIFYSSLEGGVSTVEQMPNMAILEVIRSTQPDLMMNSQLMRMHWGDYFVTIGTRNVVVGPKLPYRGWTHYRERILQAFRLLLSQSFVQGVERLSIKYTNIVPGNELGYQNAALEWDIRIGEHHLTSQATQVRTQIEGPEHLTIIQIATGAAVVMVDGSQRVGSLVDIDTLANTVTGQTAQFSAELPERLDAIRRGNKITFFSCLRDETIASMGPTYE